MNYLAEQRENVQPPPPRSDSHLHQVVPLPTPQLLDRDQDLRERRETITYMYNSFTAIDVLVWGIVEHAHLDLS